MPWALIGWITFYSTAIPIHETFESEELCKVARAKIFNSTRFNSPDERQIRVSGNAECVLRGYVTTIPMGLYPMGPSLLKGDKQ